MRNRAHPADIVWISLSLHHLETPDKRTLMQEIRAGLRADGAFLIYEPTRDDGEDRPAYLDRFENIGRRDWTAMSADEFKEAMGHVRGCDLPETEAGWIELGRDGRLHKDRRALPLSRRSLPPVQLSALRRLAFASQRGHIGRAGAIRGGPRPQFLD